MITELEVQRFFKVNFHNDAIVTLRPTHRNPKSDLEIKVIHELIQETFIVPYNVTKEKIEVEAMLLKKKLPKTTTHYQNNDDIVYLNKTSISNYRLRCKSILIDTVTINGCIYNVYKSSDSNSIHKIYIVLKTEAEQIKERYMLASFFIHKDIR